MAEVFAMRRLHTFAFAVFAAATFITPVLVFAQTSDHAATQLFLAPTGRALPKGEGYVKALGLSVPYAQGAITDRFSVGIGSPIFALGQAAMVSPKFQVQRSVKHSTSVGAIEVLTTFGSGGVTYVAHTAELESGALHVAVFAPMVRGGLREGALVMIGGEHRVNDRVMFITENYISARGSWPMLTAGVRISAKRMTWDLGWLAPVGFGYMTAGAPIISAGWKF